MAIYPIFIAVGLRQNCKQNYIFITVRLPYDVAQISPGLLHNLAKISPGLLHNLARVALRSRQNLAKISPQLQYDVSKTGRIEIRSHHSCSRMSPRLAELQYDLATASVGSPQVWQNCNAIPPQLHYYVPKTPRIAVRFRHS